MQTHTRGADAVRRSGPHIKLSTLCRSVSLSELDFATSGVYLSLNLAHGISRHRFRQVDERRNSSHLSDVTIIGVRCARGPG